MSSIRGSCPGLLEGSSQLLPLPFLHVESITGPDDFTSQTSCSSVSAMCLPDTFPFCWAPGSTTLYRRPRLGGAESLSSGHRAARCRCGPCQARPQTSRRTHHPAPSLPCWSSAGYRGSLLGPGKPGPLDGVVCIPEGPSHALPAYTQAPSGPAGRKYE